MTLAVVLQPPHARVEIFNQSFKIANTLLQSRAVVSMQDGVAKVSDGGDRDEQYRDAPKVPSRTCGHDGDIRLNLTLRAGFHPWQPSSNPRPYLSPVGDHQREPDDSEGNCQESCVLFHPPTLSRAGPHR